MKFIPLTENDILNIDKKLAENRLKFKSKDSKGTPAKAKRRSGSCPTPPVPGKKVAKKGITVMTGPNRGKTF